MYVILTYDVHQKRVTKVHKVCKRYLNHIQRSVFEGNISELKLNNLKKELSSLISPQFDSIMSFSTLFDADFGELNEKNFCLYLMVCCPYLEVKASLKRLKAWTSKYGQHEK